MRGSLKRLALVVSGVALLGALAACGDDRPCLAGHTEVVLLPVYNGKTTTFVPTTQFVCDRYGPRPTSS